ncbi:MAG: T9SS type A sorting domain-containing protein [Candidatus Symbiothrix sp.]|jgi:hypothetical protein|nr:T9SS type A sorting domain-containing protein [Candidatus Symbiothrix sp.]
MKSFRISLRNAVKTVAVLAAIALSSSAMAQEFNYTDASGVNCTYEISPYNGIDGVNLKSVNSFPTSVTKWVLPETIVNNGTTYRLFRIGAYAISAYDLLSSSLREIVFPKYMFYNDIDITPVTFPALHKVTFGEDASLFPDCTVPFDTIVFLGTGVIFWDGSLYNVFENCPATTKIIIPCGTMSQFLTAFANPYTRWNEYNGWTTANFEEAECLNTLTVLSIDVAKGDAYSFAGCGFVTTTPVNTSANHSGAITLLALPKGGLVFTGWNDGNLDNPRTVNVTADITYTAQFATCNSSAIEAVSAQLSGISIYPNPIENTLHVIADREIRNGTLTLFDMTGKLVARQEMRGSQAVINTQSLGKGVYILRLTEDGKASAGIKVVK